jgi:plasmid stabilization system protein ParE
VAGKIAVKLTANFERNLEGIERFLHEAEAAQAFDALLDALAEAIIPNLDRFPDMGREFLKRPARSIEASKGLDALRKRVDAAAPGGELREYLFAEYLILYLRQEQVVYLLAIRHHRQLSFDFDSQWGR